MTRNTIRQRYDFIDGFRAIAVLLVAASHLNNTIPEKLFWNRWATVAQENTGFNISFIADFLISFFTPLSRLGDTGLDMFFVISGFLITDILLPESSGAINIKRFYLRRVFKIIPSYFCLIAVALFVYFWGRPINIQELILSASRYFLFLQNYFVQIPVLGHTWSLVVEEHFYAVYPIILYLVFKYTSPEKRKFYLVGACIAVIVFVNIQRFTYYESGKTFFNRFWQSPDILQTTTYRCDALAFGCLLCILKKYWADAVRVPAFVGWLLIMIAMIVFRIFINYVGSPIKLFPYYLLDYLSSGLLMAGIYICGFRWGIENKFLVAIGKCSYNIYLWHLLFVDRLADWMTRYDIIIVVFLYFFSIIAAGVAGTYIIERPFLRLRSRIYP